MEVLRTERIRYVEVAKENPFGPEELAKNKSRIQHLRLRPLKHKCVWSML